MIAGGASLAPRRWSLAARGDRDAQQVAVLGDGADDGGAEDEELGVVVRRVARLEQVLARVVGHRPVVVLARAVDAGERLLVQQAAQAVPVGDALHRLHDEHVVVGGEVGVLEDRRDLVLARGDLVVPRLDRHAELEQLELGLDHAGQDALGDGAEVLVLQLLALGRLGAEEGAAGVDQVGPGVVEVLVDQEVFLLGADGGEHLRRVGAEELEDAQGLLRERLHRAEQRRLLVERLAGPRAEGGRDDERRAVGVLEDEGGAGRVPGGVAAGLERGADAAGGEAGGVGLALDQLLAAELGDRRARRRSGSGSCRASRPSGRSSAGTSGCSGSPPSRSPSPSSRSATASATVGSSGAPCLIVLRRALNTFSGRRARITSSEKTLAPKSWRTGTSLGRACRPSSDHEVIAATALWRALGLPMRKRLQKVANDRGRQERKAPPPPTRPKKGQAGAELRWSPHGTRDRPGRSDGPLRGAVEKKRGLGAPSPMGKPIRPSVASLAGASLPRRAEGAVESPGIEEIGGEAACGPAFAS